MILFWIMNLFKWFWPACTPICSIQQVLLPFQPPAKEMTECLKVHLRTAQTLAAYSWTAGFQIFKLRPKHHYLWHLKEIVSCQSLNSKCFTCTDDESYLGKLKSVARQCHGCSMQYRVLQRSILALSLFYREG